MITLQQLKYFRELANSEHLTRTAEKLYITQTTLSNTIKNLENQLGTKLFDRVGRTIQLNEAGKLYLTYVNDALQALENAAAALEDHKKGKQQSVSVATVNSKLWIQQVQGFRARYPSYSLRQNSFDKALFRNMLFNQEVDFVMAGTADLSLAGLSYHIIREEALYLCVPPDHPLTGRASIFLAEAKDEAFINLPKSDAFRSFCDELFKKAGIECHSSLECDYTLRGSLIAAGFGVAITTHTARTTNLLGSDIVYIPIADPFARRVFAIIWNPKHILGRAALDFRDYIIASETAAAAEEAR